jgi:hypothetical protein
MGLHQALELERGMTMALGKMAQKLLRPLAMLRWQGLQQMRRAA